jgi:hypothetical protein
MDLVICDRCEGYIEYNTAFICKICFKRGCVMFIGFECKCAKPHAELHEMIKDDITNMYICASSLDKSD